MTVPVHKVLIIGGGFSGMCAAIQLRKLGVAVDLVEIDPGWRSYGAGITVSGPSMRALGTVGLLPQFLRSGWSADGLDLFSADGHHLASLPTPRVAGPDIAGTGGIMRPALAKILADATRAAGAGVRLGCTFTQITQVDEGVDVAFTDGTQSRYDLVIGADGLYSKTRSTIFPQAPKPRYTGQGVWRAVARRGEVERPAMFMGRRTKAGFNPVSGDELYLFVTEERPTNSHVGDAELLPQLTALLAEFSAPVIVRIREELGTDSLIVYRPLEGMLMPRPWFDGRVLLIGDAVHATTPHLASGAGIGIEDAIVIAEELARAGSVGEALERFQARRWERCRMVVEGSLRLGEIEQTGGSKEEHAQIMRDALIALAQPI